jgi:hypothetical protein
MHSFQHIRLQTYKGLKAATLMDLQKINVICGPNNSGKTTLLECIANPKLRTIGLTFSKDTVRGIIKESATGFGWGSGERHLDNVFVQLIEQAISSEAIWFADETEKLLGKINWRQHFGNWASPSGRLPQVFPSKFVNLPKTVLVPAKRRLETIKAVEAIDAIRPDGAGILNFLFTAKNQNETSTIRKKYDAISTAFSEISAGYEFELFVTTDSHISPSPTFVELSFRRKGSSWIKANDCGLGLQELLIVLYFALASEHDVVLVEEPENHLHPEIQRRLVTFLREKAEKQFFISTHSSVFLNTQFADKVFTCRMADTIQVSNATSRAALLTELGYSIADNLVSDLVVLCEGPKDKPVLDEFFQKMGLPERGNIKVWPLGGDIMDQLDLTVFQESHQLIALIDGDPGSSVIRKRFMKKCEELQIPITRLERYSIENYFSLSAIASAMNGQMPSGLTALDHTKPVAEQLGFEVKKNGGKIAKEMKLEDIKGTDLEVFLHQVASLVASSKTK